MRALRLLRFPLLAALSTGAAAAQTGAAESLRPPAWQVGAFGGWYSGATPYRLEGAESGDVRFKAAATYGLRLCYDINPTLGVELGWTHASPEIAFSDPAAGTPGHRDLNTVDLNANVYLGRRPVRGYFTIGLGGAGTGTRGGANLTGNAGIGVQIFLGRRVALRFEGRFRETYGNLGPGDSFAYCDQTGCYAYRHKFYASGEGAAGMTYAF